MHKLLVVGITALLLAGCASTESTVTDSEMIGLWQYKDRPMWIQIDKRSRVFQCRIDGGMGAIASSGKLNIDNTIVWARIWEPSPVEIVNNSLLVDDLFGELRFERTEFPMDDECENPLK